METTKELFHQYTQQPAAEIKKARFEQWRQTMGSHPVQPTVDAQAEVRRQLGWDLVRGLK